MDSPGDLRADRARGALIGLAVGAALGMPTRRLTRAQVRARWGEVTWFAAGPPPAEFTAGAPPGTVTDDVAHALLVARELISGHEPLTAHGLRSGPGAPPEPVDAPSAAIEGVDSEGATCGAAVRIVPVGLACGPDPVADLVDLVESMDRPSHDTRLAHAGAAAVACAVSGGIEGMPADQALSLALAAAAEGGLRGHPVPGADVGARIAWACGLARAAADPLEVIDLLVGTSAANQESVPAAFAIAAITTTPGRAASPRRVSAASRRRSPRWWGRCWAPGTACRPSRPRPWPPSTRPTRDST